MILDIALQTETLAALGELRALLIESCEQEGEIGNIVRIQHIIGERPDADERQQVIEHTERLLQIVTRMRALADQI
jgi:hypothetical protein